MNLECPQFVPQEVCLSCQGCCRFKDDSTPWRAKFSADEMYAIRRRGPSLYETIFSNDTLREDNFLKTQSHQGCFECHFFTRQSNSCGIYELRPLECRLYPFILNRKDDKIFLCVHLSCPHIQDHLDSPGYTEFIEELRKYFASSDVQKWVKGNYKSINDYSSFDDELKILFEIPVGEMTTPFSLFNERFSFERALLNETPQISGQAFPNVFLWQDFFDFRMETIEGALCVFAHTPGRVFLYLPPLGKPITPKMIEGSFAVMDQYNKRKDLGQIEHVSENQLRFFPEDKFVIYKKGHEYCYDKEDIVGLKGNAFKSKRHDLNHFVKHRAAQFVSYHPSMKQECLALFGRWGAERSQKHDDPIYLQMLEDNKKVHPLALEYFEEIGLTGRVAIVDGEIKAYSFGYPINRSTFCILFEVADLNVTGLPVYVFNSFCRDEELQEYTTINVMDDFGMEHVKETKLSFHPTGFTPTYSITRRLA